MGKFTGLRISVMLFKYFHILKWLAVNVDYKLVLKYPVIINLLVISSDKIIIFLVETKIQVLI